MVLPGCIIDEENDGVEADQRAPSQDLYLSVCSSNRSAECLNICYKSFKTYFVYCHGRSAGCRTLRRKVDSIELRNHLLIVPRLLTKILNHEFMFENFLRKFFSGPRKTQIGVGFKPTVETHTNPTREPKNGLSELKKPKQGKSFLLVIKYVQDIGGLAHYAQYASMCFECGTRIGRRRENQKLGN
jgi:hypothetical protein